MNIDLVEIPIRDIVEGYTNSDDEGVFGFGGRLDIRPKYQRNFIYNENDSREVINTINKGFPLNVMYWVIYEGDYQIIEHEDHTKEFIPSEDAKFQVLDGQQRTISFCEYVKKALDIPALRVTGDLNKKIQKVAVLGGSGEKYIHHAKKKGADVYITGDMTFHMAQEASLMGLGVIDAGHYIEKIMKQFTAAYLKEHLDKENLTILVSESNTDPFQFV